MARHWLTPALALLALVGCDRAPSDATLRRRFAANRATFDRICRDLRPSGAAAVGRAPDGIRLSAHGRMWFTEPSDGELAAAGVDPTAYQRLVTALADVEARSAEQADDGVTVVVHRTGIVPSSSATQLVCGRRPPAPLVDDSEHFATSHGYQCAALTDGWWICREWT